jgi:hypothetical protein
MYSIAIGVVAALRMAGQDRPVFDLSDRDCQDEVLISIIDDARVHASCATDGDERIMRVSVTNVAPPEKGRLRDFSIGFCGPSVVRASGPAGWEVKIDEEESVTWSLPDSLVDERGIPSGSRLEGFIIRLRPGWKRSRSDSAWWGEANIVAQVTTHDCP